MTPFDQASGLPAALASRIGTIAASCWPVDVCIPTL